MDNGGFRYPLHCHAVWNTDEGERRISASGGVATALGRYVIEKEKGVVFGTAYDASFTPALTYTESVEGLECFKGSKYVQSIVSPETYKVMQSFLDDGRTVLFVGLPCQVAAMKSVVRPSAGTLFTADLICHGAVPVSYFKDELAYLNERSHFTNVTDIRFRGNDGHNFRLSVWSGGKCLYSESGEVQPYLAGFLRGLTLKEACYGCRFSRPERGADITLGDFIGLGRTVAFDHQVRNVSCVFTNTSAGDSLFSGMMEFLPQMRSEERTVEERLVYRPSLLMPFPRHPERDRFLALEKKHGAAVAIRRTLRWDLLLARLNQYVIIIKRTLHIKWRITKQQSDI